jgi:hypothetical protein
MARKETEKSFRAKVEMKNCDSSLIYEWVKENPKFIFKILISKEMNAERQKVVTGWM